jgi:hypothetical protein
MKYGNQKTTIDGITFDSRREAERYADLKILEKAGQIHSLELQPKFEIISSVTWKGKTYRERYYIADFRYWENGRHVVEDVKGCRNQIYLLKRQLFLRFYGKVYEFRET